MPSVMCAVLSVVRMATYKKCLGFNEMSSEGAYVLILLLVVFSAV